MAKISPMAQPKIILFYRFTPIENTQLMMLWQRQLCESLNLKGRIIISKHGINGTLGGELKDIKSYIRKTREFDGLRDTDFKFSNGLGNDFPKLSVKVRKELVAFTIPDEIKVDENGVVGGGKHLKPEEVNQLVEEKKDVVFFDGRNAVESKVGRFKDAITPDIESTHEFIEQLESGKYDFLKDKPVVTYCTGGVRCEILSVAMKNRGFKEVYQIDGGIVRYGERFKDEGLWQGSVMVFDNRMVSDFSNKAKLIGECEICGAKTNHIRNCFDETCKNMVVVCKACEADESVHRCDPSHTRNRQKVLVTD